MITKMNKLSIAGIFIAGSLIYLFCLAYLQPKDPIVFGVHACYLLFLCLFACLILSKVRNKEIRILYSIVFGGILLRFIYSISTPFFVRAYDVAGHLQYIHYVQNNWLSIPEILRGWEFFQPPIYYWLASLFVLPAKLFGTNETVISGLKLFSFSISVGTLLLAMWIAKMIFDTKKDFWKVCVFISIFAVLPVVVYHTTRNSNDVMYFAVALLFFGYLWKWWTNCESKDLYLAFIFLGLGLITKGNSIPLIGVIVLSILLRKQVQTQERINYILLGALILFLISGWYYGCRYAFEGNLRIIGNANQLNRKLIIDMKPSNFLKFNFIKVIKTPYNNGWSRDSDRHYWEVFVRSVFTGQWNMGEKVHSVSRILIILSTVLTLIMLASLVGNLLWSPRENVPLWSLLIMLFAAHIGIVYIEKINPTQYMRLITPVIIPMAFYLIDGVRIMPKCLKKPAIGLIWLFIAMCIVLYVAVLTAEY